MAMPENRHQWKGFPQPNSRKGGGEGEGGSGSLRSTASWEQQIKGGAHPSPFPALSFPESKKVPIYCWVDRVFQSSKMPGRVEPDSRTRGPGFDTRSNHILSFLLR